MNRKILIVDDRPETVQVLKNILEEEGYEIVVADQGESALKLMRESFFHLALVDLKMPGIDGVEIIKEMKKQYRRTVPLVITGCDDYHLIKKAVEEGAAAVLYKPFSPPQLLTLIEHYSKNVKKPSILIVDDVPATLDSLRYILEEHNYEVDIVENGEQALEKVKKGNFSFVFMDINLPGMDGLTVQEEIKKIKPDLPILLMSGYDPSRWEGRLQGQSYLFLSKPLEIDRILEILSGFLGSKK